MKPPSSILKSFKAGSQGIIWYIPIKPLHSTKAVCCCISIILNEKGSVTRVPSLFFVASFEKLSKNKYSNLVWYYYTMQRCVSVAFVCDYVHMYEQKQSHLHFPTIGCILININDRKKLLGFPDRHNADTMHHH